MPLYSISHKQINIVYFLTYIHYIESNDHKSKLTKGYTDIEDISAA